MMADQLGNQPGGTQQRPLTYDQAEARYPAGSRGAAERFRELSQRNLSARTAATLDAP
jgi:hypothetical protein